MMTTAIAVMMMIYYMIFGGVSVLALGINLLLLVALLSMLQATLTLPGLAAIALVTAVMGVMRHTLISLSSVRMYALSLDLNFSPS